MKYYCIAYPYRINKIFNVMLTKNLQAVVWIQQRYNVSLTKHITSYNIHAIEYIIEHNLYDFDNYLQKNMNKMINIEHENYYNHSKYSPFEQKLLHQQIRKNRITNYKSILIYNLYLKMTRNESIINLNKAMYKAGARGNIKIVNLLIEYGADEYYALNGARDFRIYYMINYLTPIPSECNCTYDMCYCNEHYSGYDSDYGYHDYYED